MNPYGSVEVPDHVPDEWQRRYGGEHVRDDTEDPAEAEVRARAAVIRLLAWVGAVTTIGVVVMWPATHLPRFLAILAFVGLGTVAVLVFARWVLRATEPGMSRHKRRRRRDHRPCSLRTLGGIVDS